jgi:2-keto-4-pentenoate hydratase/2-oxohepta-3-ene-1,7-dioic acid hydratase in catechol pathway
MRWCTYLTSDGPRAGLITDDRVYGLAEPHNLIELIASDAALREAGQRALREPAGFVPLADARLTAPIPVPPSIRDFMAFEEHVVTSHQAMGQTVHPDWYELPVFYFTNPAAVHGPYDDVAISPGSTAFDYELEIAAVIGAPGRDIAAADAEAHIAGYTVLCDWSARDLQEREMRLLLGPAKGKDSATSIGPVLVTADELEPQRAGNAYDLSMTAAVNGKPYSQGNFSTIHWSFPAMIEHASRGTELRTGDIIGSGTVGTGCILELSRSHGQGAYPWLKPGDIVTLTVERIGTIEATIVSSRG